MKASIRWWILFSLLQIWMRISLGCLDGLSEVDCSSGSPVQVIRKVPNRWVTLPMDHLLVQMNAITQCACYAAIKDYFAYIFFAGISISYKDSKSINFMYVLMPFDSFIHRW